MYPVILYNPSDRFLKTVKLVLELKMNFYGFEQKLAAQCDYDSTHDYSGVFFLTGWPHEDTFCRDSC